jgi:L-amino acid N-acyltransferase YncA
VIEVTPAAAADIPAVIPLAEGYQRFYEVETDPAATEAMLRRFLAPSADGVLLVARADDEIVGYACVHWRLDTLEARTVGYLHDLYVASDARTRGAGGELIKAAADACRAHGSRVMVWHTAPDNTVARRIYDAGPAEASEWIEYQLTL